MKTFFPPVAACELNLLVSLQSQTIVAVVVQSQTIVAVVVDFQRGWILPTQHFEGAIIDHMHAHDG